jgi:uridylate kinase
MAPGNYFPGLNIVLKLGGHLLFREEFDVGLLRQYTSLLSELFDGGRWVVVVGGGDMARKYVSAARRLGLDEASCDELAIQTTRIHAGLLARALGELACQKIPTTVDEIRHLSEMGRIVVSGGLQPGQSTMAVSVLAAAVTGAERIVVATDVDGIYTSDPKKDPNAKIMPRMKFEELAGFAANVSQRAGDYQVVDLVGVSLLLRTRIPLYYVNGERVEMVREAILGRKAGTIVSD